MRDLKSKGRAAAGTLASLTMIASMSAVPALAVAPGDGADGNAAADPQAEVGENAAVAGAVKVARAEGVFSYDQEAVTPNETIRTMFQKAVRVVCGAGIALASENPLDWQLTVSGAVNDAYTASVGDLAGDESVQQKMTCTCGGNPAGGRAIVTANVKGIPVESILERAGVQPGANAVTFVSADGTETMLPLGYVIGRHGVLSYEINEEALTASVGGSNPAVDDPHARELLRARCGGDRGIGRGRGAGGARRGRRASQQPECRRASGRAGVGSR